MPGPTLSDLCTHDFGVASLFLPYNTSKFPNPQLFPSPPSYHPSPASSLSDAIRSCW